MKKIKIYVTAFVLVLVFVCCQSYSQNEPKSDSSPVFSGEAVILQSWQGDYSVTRLDLLPVNQREHAVGFISDEEAFALVWAAFNPAEALPKIDFNVKLVLFARNIEFYNSIRIGKVRVSNSVAEVMAMETMSAMPIEEYVSISMVVVSRKGIKAIQSGDEIISVYRSN